MNSAQIGALINILALGAMMLSTGMQVTLAELLAFARRKRLVLLGVLANYGAVPLATVGLLALFRADPLVSAGFLVLAVCPGAPVAPPFTKVAGGSLPVATGMMVLLGGTSTIVSPLLLKWLLELIETSRPLEIDHAAIVVTLLSAQLFPLAVGLGIRHWFPKLADRAMRPLAGVSAVLLLTLVIMILARQFDTLAAIKLRGWVGMAILIAVSTAVGWLCGANREERKAMALSTVLRNAAVALVIATSNFAGTAALTAVVAYSLFSILGGLGIARIMRACS